MRLKAGDIRILCDKIMQISLKCFMLYNKTWLSLHCALSLAVQCIVIGPICGFVCVCVCGSVTTITRNCVHQSSPNWVYR